MKNQSITRSIINRVTRRFENSQEIEKRALVMDVLEPRVLFSGSPAPAPEPAPEPAPAQEAPAPESAPAAEQNSESDSQVAAPPEDTSGEDSSPASTGADTAVALTDAEIQAVADVAAQRWADSGISEEQRAALTQISYQVANLDPGRLASANGNSVTIDDDAAGLGWFVDSTPYDDSEFGADGSVNGVDLLTAILHEQGHVLGVPEITSTIDLMDEFLGAGERRLPTDGLAATAVPGEHGEIEYLTIRAGTGAASLIGNDLTDLDGIHDEVAYNGTTNLGGFDAVFFSSASPGFGGGEFAFNVFDNQVGGGNAKVCCDNAPITIGADFTNTLATGDTLIQLTGFTLTSSNDSPGRDPSIWRIQGSSDTTTGLDGTWSTIYEDSTAGAAWTARNQVISYSAADGDVFIPNSGFKAFRMVTDSVVSGTAFALNEIEFFGFAAVADTDATDEDTAINATAPGVLANDLGEGAFVSDSDSTSALGASVTVNMDGSYSYDPTVVSAFQALAAGETAADTFSYTASVPVPNGDGLMGVQVINTTGTNPGNSTANWLAVYDALDGGAGPTGTVAGFNVQNNTSDTETLFDYAGGGGDFGTNNAIGTINGDGPGGGPGPFNPGGTGGSDYSIRSQAYLQFTVGGTYTIAMGSDDGRRIELTEAFAGSAPGYGGFTSRGDQVNGAFASGDTVVGFDGGTGHNQSTGTFTVAAGDILALDAFFYEGGGGDSGEISLASGNVGTFNTTDFALLQDGLLGVGISSGQLEDTATVTVTVTGVNDAPVAFDDTSYTTAEDTVLNVPTAGTTAQPASSLILEQDPLLYYRMDEAGGATADNQGSLGAAADGTLIGDTAPGSVGQVNGAFSFDGNGDYISTGATASQLGIQNGSFTASAWVMPDATNGDRTIFGTDQTGTNQGLHLIIRDGKAHFGFFANDTGGSATIPTGEWTHLTWVYDAGAQTQTLYVNGVQDAQGTGKGQFTGNDVVNVGRWAGSRYFDGLMDEVSIIGEALSAPEIAAIYNSGYNDGLLANDTDPDVDGNAPNDTLTVTGVGGGGIGTAVTLTSGATVTAQSDGSFDYDPNGQFESLAVGETATDTFTYTISDGNGGTDTAIATVTITGVNDVPTAVDDTYATDEDSVLDVAVVPFANQALSGTASQSSTAFGGVASRANDGNTNGSYGGNSVTHTDSSAFNFWQVELAETSDIEQIVLYNRTDGCCVNRLAQFRVSVFDGDPDNGGKEVFFVNEPGTPGTAPYVIDVATLDPNVRGNFIRVAIDPASAAGDAGMDGDGVNPAGGTLSLAEVQVFGYSGLLGNDTDPDTNDTLTVAGSDETSAQGATVSVNTDGSFTYDPGTVTTIDIHTLDAGDPFTDTFTYTITDGNHDGKIRTVGIDISGGGGSTDSQINSTAEAESIYAAALAAGFDFANGQTGTVVAGGQTYFINSSGEELDDRVDYGGANRDFTPNENYPGVTSGEDFLLHSEWSMLLQAGTYTIYGDGDDGFSLKLSGVTFDAKFGSGAGEGAANELRFNGPTGSANTGGSFTLAEDTVVNAEMVWFERGGGDFFELAIQSGTTTNGTPDGSYQIIADGVLGMLVASDPSQFSTATATINVTGVNDAPVLTPGGVDDFDGVAVNDPMNDGNLVSEILDSSVFDIDDSAVEGIAIIGTTVSNTAAAQFEYQLDGTTAWVPIADGSLTPGTALLLRAEDRIRFSPNGLEQATGSIDYKAWDQTGATAGDEGNTENTVPDGGTSPFSTATATSNAYTVNVTIENGVLQYGEEEGRHDEVTIWSDGTSVFIHDDAGPVTTDAGVQIDANTVSILLADFEDFEFNSNDFDDTIIIKDMDGFDGSLTIDGEDGFDSVTFAAGMGLELLTGDDGVDENLDVDAETFFANLDSSVSVVGDGTIDITATGGGAEDVVGIQLRRAGLSSEDGAITLVGEGGSSGNHNDGVLLSHGSSITTTGGSVSITGTATSAAGPNDGVSLVGGSDITVGGAGTITITGTSNGASDSYGVQLFTGTELTSAEGDISLAGGGNGTGARNSGIYTNGATVTTTGAGSISLDGEGSGGGTNSKGLRLTASTLEAAGTGGITLTGTGGGGTSTNVGVEVGVRTSLTTASGDVTITGEGAGSATRNAGVSFLSRSSVDSGGGITVTGTGGDGTSHNDGVSLVSATLDAGGDISVTGVGAGSGNYNRGIDSTRSSFGGGEVTLTGTGTQNGGGSARFGDGVYLNRGGATAAGTLTIGATGGTGSSNNRGLYASGVTLGGTLAVTGTADAGTTGSGNAGVFIQNSTLSALGTIAGTGGGGTGPNFGVYMQNIAGGLPATSVTTDPNDDDEKGGNYFNILPALVLAAGADRRSRSKKAVKQLSGLVRRLQSEGGMEDEQDSATRVYRMEDGHIGLVPLTVEADVLADAGIGLPEAPEGGRHVILLTGDNETGAGVYATTDAKGEVVSTGALVVAQQKTVSEILSSLSGADQEADTRWSARKDAAEDLGNGKANPFDQVSRSFHDALGLQ